jgi:hypothetical protein
LLEQPRDGEILGCGGLNDRQFVLPRGICELVSVDQELSIAQIRSVNWKLIS